MVTPNIVEEFAEFLRNNYLYAVSSISLDPDFTDDELVRWNLDNGIVLRRTLDTEVRFYIYTHNASHIGMSRYNVQNEEFEVTNFIQTDDQSAAIAHFLKIWNAGTWINFA